MTGLTGTPPFPDACFVCIGLTEGPRVFLVSHDGEGKEVFKQRCMKVQDAVGMGSRRVWFDQFLSVPDAYKQYPEAMRQYEAWFFRGETS